MLGRFSSNILNKSVRTERADNFSPFWQSVRLDAEKGVPGDGLRIICLANEMRLLDVLSQGLMATSFQPRFCFWGIINGNQMTAEG